MRTERFDFEGHDGNQLSARLEIPSGSPRAAAVFAHCFTCSKDVRAAARISRGLASHGVVVLRFDFTGLGSSEGDFASTNFSSNVQDLLVASRVLSERFPIPQLLVGHSLGGAAVLMAAPKLDRVLAVATVNAPCHPEHAKHLLAGKIEDIEREGEAEVSLGGRPFTIQKQFLDDLTGQPMQDAIRGLRRPLMVFHAPQDELVGIDQARQIFESARHPKSFVSLDTADHLLSDKADSEYVAHVLEAWLSRYIQGPEETDTAVQATGVRVHETGTGTFTNQISAGRHRLLGDEPGSVGGDDLGPSPYEYLLGALGACTNMTVRMYADRKGWPLSRIATELTHRKIHARDCADCETKDGKVDEIIRKIVLEGDLSEEQRQRMMEIADKCPVHRTLHREVKVRTEGV